MSKPLSVVIVEDNPDEAESMARELSLAGFEPRIQIVKTEQELAVALDPATPLPDVILSNYSLPAFDGLSALRMVRERGLDIPFIMVSGSIGEELAVKAIQQGASDFLHKDSLKQLGHAAQRAIDQRRISESLRASDVRFQAVIERSADCIALLDEARHIFYVSPSVMALEGRTPEELAGSDMGDYTHPDDVQLVHDSFQRILLNPGQFLLAQWRRRHKNGQWLWLEGVCRNMLADPAVRAVVVNYRDISDRKQSEERVQHQIGEFEAINRISNALREALTLPALLDKLIDETLLMVGASIGSIWLYDAENDEVRIVVYRGWTIDNPPPLRRGEGIPGTVVATGLAHLSSDFSTDNLIAPEMRVLVPAGLGGACIPIRSQTETIGVLFVEVMQPHVLSESEVRLLTTVTEIAGIAIHRMRLYAQTERRLHQLAALREIDIAILGSTNLRMTLDLLLGQVPMLLGTDAAIVLLLDVQSHTLGFAAASGFHSRAVEQVRIRVGEGQAGQAVLERRITVANLGEVGLPVAYAPLLAQEGFASLVVVPLIAKGQVNGVLAVFHRQAFTPNAEWLELLDTLAGQAALAVDNSQLFGGLQQANLELTMAYDTTLEGWSRALDLRDKETEGHTLRVTELTLELACTMGLDGAELVPVRRGALLHDIGKMGVPDSILLKPGPLTAEEWVIMRMHPTYARDLLSPIAYLNQALDIPYCHHEKWDGTGYPRGLAGEQIPLTARLFSIIDVWDALRSDRPYRPAWPVEKVREHIRTLSGTHFDPQVVTAFLNLGL